MAPGRENDASGGNRARDEQKPERTEPDETETDGGKPAETKFGETELGAAIRARLASLDAGAYRTNSEMVLTQFEQFLREQRDIERLDEITVIDCRRYSQWLRQRVQDPEDNLSASSAAGPYFAVVRAFLSWCVDDERLDANPARPNRVKEPLPEVRGDHERQFWREEHREELLSFVDERARRALDGEADVDRKRAYRDRTVVTLLALTGVRGAEVFHSPRDDRRNGLRWADVDLEQGIATVLGKVRETQPVPLLDRVVAILDRHKRVQDPPTEEWPVVPTAHAPSLARTAREALAERGWARAEIEDALDDTPARELLRREEISPPALSTNGARSLMQRLCEAAGVEIDGEYLKPHGGRRGIGSEVYAEDAELAQELLRHESIETTHEAYREQVVAETRDRIEDVLDGS
jgi:integrase